MTANVKAVPAVLVASASASRATDASTEGCSGGYIAQLRVAAETARASAVDCRMSSGESVVTDTIQSSIIDRFGSESNDGPAAASATIEATKITKPVATKLTKEKPKGFVIFVIFVAKVFVAFVAEPSRPAWLVRSGHGRPAILSVPHAQC